MNITVIPAKAGMTKKKGKMPRLFTTALFLAFLFLPHAAQAGYVAPPLEPAPAKAGGIAMHGTPKYAAGFDHLGYVNGEAPKGGELRISRTGTFGGSGFGFICRVSVNCTMTATPTSAKAAIRLA